MNHEYLPVMTLAVFLVALLYSSVGHAGASGYIAVMALFSLPPAVIRPTALILNIAVACIASYQFSQAGFFRWRLFWPLALLSIPCAFLGGCVNVPTRLFKVLVGVVLLAAAARFFVKPSTDDQLRSPPLPTALATGGGLGLLAGLTGTGGGIFLTPLMLLLRWAGTKSVAAVSAMFILVNSLAGLAGNLSSTRHLPLVAGPLLAAAAVGGTAGSYLGSHRFPVLAIKRLLAVVLMVAGGKLILT